MRYLKLFENYTNIEISEVFNGQIDIIVSDEEISLGVDGSDIYFLTDDDEEIANDINFSIEDNYEYLLNRYKKELSDNQMRRFGFFK